MEGEFFMEGYAWRKRSAWRERSAWGDLHGGICMEDSLYCSTIAAHTHTISSDAWVDGQRSSCPAMRGMVSLSNTADGVSMHCLPHSPRWSFLQRGTTGSVGGMVYRLYTVWILKI